jgi:8-amino-7-oxononanoate synthase
VRYFGLTQEEVPIQMGTLSKALGAQGGFIAGSETLVQFLRNRARSFVYSTAPAPATMAAARKAIDVAREASKQRERVDQHITHLHGTLRDAGLRVLPEQPRTAIMGILVGDPEQALEFSDRLEEEELLIPAVRPPTVPRGMSRLRLTVMATHTEQQVHRAASTIVDVAEEVL